MKLITYCHSIEELELAATSGVSELILGHQGLSKFSRFDTAQLHSLANACSQKGIRPILEWDVLHTEDVFQKSLEIADEIDFSLFGAVRAQDPGVTNYILENKPQLKIQLLLENGNHNFQALSAWVNRLGDRLDRIVLSLELPATVVGEYIAKLPVPVELLGVGKILLFYSPRYLLSAAKSDYQNFTMVKGSSEESPHKGFPILQNDHGTFMFHIRDQFILEHLPQLQEMNLEFFRVDLRFGGDFSLITKIAEVMKNFDAGKVKEIKDAYPEKTTRGYYSVNKTDVILKKLKNADLIRDDENYVGEVLEMYRGKHLAIAVKNPRRTLKLGDKLLIKTPEHRQVEAVVTKLQNTLLEDIDEAGNGTIALINFVKKSSSRSAVYFL